MFANPGSLKAHHLESVSDPDVTDARGSGRLCASSLGDAVVTWQASLFGSDDPEFDPTFARLERTWLDELTWLDLVPGWLGGSDQAFAELVARVPWTQRTVTMFDRRVAEPRLTWWWTERGAERLPLVVLAEMASALSSNYGVSFDALGANLYRNGRDSVAWHADRERLTQPEPIVAIVSVGAPRPFLLRRRGGGPSQLHLLGQGDLLVMGGACQHHWEHAVPKVAAAGPRISLTYRHGAFDHADRSPHPPELRHPR